MGMASSDDEEQIMRDYATEQEYRRLYPHRAPPSGATEDELAFFSAEVRRWADRDPSR